MIWTKELERTKNIIDWINHIGRIFIEDSSTTKHHFYGWQTSIQHIHWILSSYQTKHQTITQRDKQTNKQKAQQATDIYWTSRGGCRPRTCQPEQHPPKASSFYTCTYYIIIQTKNIVLTNKQAIRQLNKNQTNYQKSYQPEQHPPKAKQPAAPLRMTIIHLIREQPPNTNNYDISHHITARTAKSQVDKLFRQFTIPVCTQWVLEDSTQLSPD